MVYRYYSPRNDPRSRSNEEAGLAIQLSFPLTSPQSYLDLGNAALLPLHRWLTAHVISLSPVAFGLLVLTFDVMMAC